MNAKIHRKSYGSLGFTSKIFIHTFPSSAASLECETSVEFRPMTFQIFTMNPL